MDAFSTALNTIFADPNLAVAATFIPLQGANSQVMVLTKKPDLYEGIGQSVIDTPTLILEVQVSDCPALVEGDRFLIGNITYVVQGAPQRDLDRLIWLVDCYEV